MREQASYEEYAERFWSKVNVKGDDECWIWTGWIPKNATSFGYGVFCFEGKNMYTHRFAYEFLHGKGSAKDKVIRHTCDNPPCCNPFHLKKGTQKDNIKDKIERGRDRYLVGDECSWKKLTADDVIEIKEMLAKGIMHKDIARRFDVDTVTITDINIGRSWKHIQPELIAEKRQSIRTYISTLLRKSDPNKVVIHYIDGNKENQANSNIVVCPDHAYHSLLIQRKNAYEACGHADWIKCTYCKQYDKPENMYQKKSKTNYRPDESFYRFHKKCQLEFQRTRRGKK